MGVLVIIGGGLAYGLWASTVMSELAFLQGGQAVGVRPP